ncbi:uncharacterized protein LOC110876516 [Helianthus annuus]|uniref:uncharacterized protein LOC110876516 n=1 Tax=Helianthus annuus TaxID=4232 RepID=UPI000B905BE5|nr:uncharacterized protein LOC110876516 [Helianthus annuus]
MAEYGDISDSLDDTYEEEETDNEDQIGYGSNTSAAQARTGKYIQGFPWRGMHLTREQYRRGRRYNTKTMKTFPYPVKLLIRAVTPTVVHFQLRNMVCATSKHDVYVVSNDSIMHWSLVSQNITEILNISRHVAPTERLQVAEYHAHAVVSMNSQKRPLLKAQLIFNKCLRSAMMLHLIKSALSCGISTGSYVFDFF